jgi:hypothetical protein
MRSLYTESTDTASANCRDSGWHPNRVSGGDTLATDIVHRLGHVNGHRYTLLPGNRTQELDSKMMRIGNGVGAKDQVSNLVAGVFHHSQRAETGTATIRSSSR